MEITKNIEGQNNVVIRPDNFSSTAKISIEIKGDDNKIEFAGDIAGLAIFILT